MKGLHPQHPRYIPATRWLYPDIFPAMVLSEGWGMAGWSMNGGAISLAWSMYWPGFVLVGDGFLVCTGPHPALWYAAHAGLRSVVSHLVVVNHRAATLCYCMSPLQGWQGYNDSLLGAGFTLCCCDCGVAGECQFLQIMEL